MEADCADDPDDDEPSPKKRGQKRKAHEPAGPTGPTGRKASQQGMEAKFVQYVNEHHHGMFGKWQPYNNAKCFANDFGRLNDHLAYCKSKCDFTSEELKESRVFAVNNEIRKILMANGFWGTPRGDQATLMLMRFGIPWSQRFSSLSIFNTFNCAK